MIVRVSLSFLLDASSFCIDAYWKGSRASKPGGPGCGVRDFSGDRITCPE